MNVLLAGVGSVIPEWVALTLKVCWPRLSRARVWGLEQGFDAPPSIRHANVAGVRLDLNLKVGVRSVV